METFEIIMKYINILLLVNIGFVVSKSHNQQKYDTNQHGFVNDIYDELAQMANLEQYSQNLFNSMSNWLGFKKPHSLKPKFTNKRYKETMVKRKRKFDHAKNHKDMTNMLNGITIFEFDDNIHSLAGNQELNVPNINDLNLEIEMILNDVTKSRNPSKKQKFKNNENMIWPPYATNTSPAKADSIKKIRAEELKERRYSSQNKNQLVWPPYVTNIKKYSSPHTTTMLFDTEERHSNTWLFILRVIFIASLATITTISTYQIFKFIAIHVFGLVESLPEDENEEIQRKLLYSEQIPENMLIKKSSFITI